MCPIPLLHHRRPLKHKKNTENVSQTSSRGFINSQTKKIQLHTIKLQLGLSMVIVNQLTGYYLTILTIIDDSELVTFYI